MCIDPEDVKKHLTPNTKAIIAVNQAGVPAPIDKIREFYDGLIIEDCAHSCYTPGAGQAGDIAIWSFQAVKTMPCGDGGMITLNDEKLYNKLKEMTWFGVSSTFSRVAKNNKDTVSGKPGYTWDYEVDKIGYKCYMIDINAAICLEQMKKLPDLLSRRRYIQKQYGEYLHELVERPPFTDTVQYYCAKVPAECRDDLIDYLASKNIHTSVHFKPLHKYEIIDKHMTHPNREFPVADKEWLKLISLPVHPAMSNEDIDYVIYWVNEYFKINF
jgi:perosamine synthetase